MIRVIHIADLHLESEILSYNKKEIIKALANDLKSFVNEETLFFFTGDLIDKGGMKFQNKKIAFKKFEELFLNVILEINPLLKGKVFVVPGNHDVYREKIDPISEAGLKASLTDINGLNSFIENNRVESKHLERLVDFQDWLNGFYKKYNDCETTNFDNSFQITLGRHKVGVTTLNSSWLCKDENDKENILVGKNQIENSLSKIEKCDIKLALCHHPMEFLNEFDRESCKLLLYKNYDMLFTGHVHELASSYTQDLFGNIFISIANSTIGDTPIERKYVNGYTIIDFYPSDKIKAHYRKFIEQHKTFVPNTDIGTENGCKEFLILKDEKLQLFEKNQIIINGIESRYCEKLNEHIIMSGGQTNANCTIESLFVEPSILNYPQGLLRDEDKVEYNIDYFLSNSPNFIIYGLKESGKTILLDKMFIEAIKRYNQYNKIPVLLKFSDFKKNEPVRVIREFLSISNQEIDEFLKQNKVILFIDDFVFNEKSKEQLTNLKNFIANYPTIQVIATADQILENVMPTDYLEHNDVFNFNIAFIQDFSSSKIRELIIKWFAGREVDLQENMQKLVKSFIDFGLPKTPLTITMFLWIFEKQEKRPINNSVLVELFIENLLEKTNIENIYSDTFDFKNKQRLLSFISKYMKDSGNPDLSYSVDYVDLLAYVKTYLSSRFHGQPQKVLDDLIRRGILTYEDDNLIRFKSAFFFHYFLALHFDYDSVFKGHVFTDENYLDYTEEINYYSGLKRDNLDVLLFTQEKLHNAFGQFNNDIKNNYSKVDNVLEAKTKEGTVTFQLDNSITENKLSEKQIDKMYDDSLSQIPVQKTIPKKGNESLNTRQNIDLVLKLACNVLKNSEDVDDFEAKKLAYSNTLVSSISFLMQYRDALIMHNIKYKKQPENFPKNIDFNLFIKVIPLIHQVVIYNWLGSQKLRPVIIDKIEKDKISTNISDYEKYLSIFIYGDIKGSDYPEIIKNFVKSTKFNYLKDLSFLKLMSYYHLRTNSIELDKFYLKLMSEIGEDLGKVKTSGKSQFMRELEEKKKAKNQ
jgi:predicted MPP superfamily phosphohydrolase